MLIVLLLAVAIIISGPGRTMSAVLLIAVMAGVPAGNVIHNLRNMKNQ
jgi:UDP-N-acetylmuramyl pentapeptide phosphotransferase/UDP-N-acetylglucosamine-1-phosphate transferase